MREHRVDWDASWTTAATRGAGSWGRRPLLLIGLGALPIRAAFFALVDDPALLVAIQANLHV
jgi:hypothetical protein